MRELIIEIKVGIQEPVKEFGAIAQLVEYLSSIHKAPQI